MTNLILVSYQKIKLSRNRVDTANVLENRDLAASGEFGLTTMKVMSILNRFPLVHVIHYFSVEHQK